MVTIEADVFLAECHRWYWPWKRACRKDNRVVLIAVDHMDPTKALNFLTLPRMASARGTSSTYTTRL